MALQANFTKNNIGVPIPDCYIKVDTVFYDSIDKTLRAHVVFYVNQTQRLNDVREKRKTVETQIEAKKAEIVAEQSKPSPDVAALETSQRQLATLYALLEGVTGDAPFYAKTFEFPVTGTEAQNAVALAYAKLKASAYTGRDDGRAIELDFTKALDV